MKTKEDISKAAKESCKLHRHAMRYNHMIDQFKAGVNWYKEYADQETSVLRQELEETKEQLKTGQDAFVTNWDALNDAKLEIQSLSARVSELSEELRYIYDFVHERGSILIVKENNTYKKLQSLLTSPQGDNK